MPEERSIDIDSDFDLKIVNSFIKKNNKVESVILPIGDGLSVCRKI